jgi:hypothetical protein
MFWDRTLDADTTFNAWVLQRTYQEFIVGFINRRNLEVPDAFVPPAKAFAVADEAYLPYMVNPMGIFGIKPRWRWFGDVRDNLFEVYNLDDRCFSVRGYECALRIYKKLWVIEREFPKFAAVKTHDVLALEATPILFANPKIAKAVAQLCHPNPGHEAECMHWIPITT